MGKKRRGMGVQTGRFGGVQPWELPGGKPKEIPIEIPTGWEMPDSGDALARAFARQMERMMFGALGVGETPAAELPVTEEGFVEMIRGRREIAGSTVTYRFDSYADMVDQAEHRWKSGFHNPRMKESRDTNEGDWAGTRTWDDAITVAREGWRNGLDRVSALLEEIAVTTDTMAFVDVKGFDVAGPYPIVPMYCGGDPEHFALPGAVIGTHAVVELVLPVGATAGYGAKELMHFGAALLAFVDRLEAAGKRVGVTTVEGFQHGNKMIVQTRVKRPENPISLDTMAVALAHPATFRRFGFALLESCSRGDWVQRFSMGYGQTLKITAAMLQDLEDPVVLPSLSEEGKWGSAKDAIASMRKILAARMSGWGDDDIDTIIGEAA